MCIQYIYRHIRMLPPTRIFTTRHMLIYGSRSAVDSALHRMVQSNFIIRLARGVFVRDDSSNPTIAEIAEAKAKAFGIKIARHAETILRDLNLTTKASAAVFAKTGHSSSFWTIRGRVRLKGICQKKMSLCRTPVGRVIYALWHWGRRRCSFTDVMSACKTFGRTQREQFWLSGSL